MGLNVLNKEYVLTGRIDVESAHFFAELESLRDAADYNVFFKPPKKKLWNTVQWLMLLLRTLGI